MISLRVRSGSRCRSATARAATSRGGIGLLPREVGLASGLYGSARLPPHGAGHERTSSYITIGAAVEAGRYEVGLIGAGIGASLSPALHEREAERHGMEYAYRLLDIGDAGAADIGALLAAARGAGFSGLNVTHPCKQDVVAHLDALSPDAAALQAVNTGVFDGARAVGHNTDATGFAESFARGLPQAALHHVVLL